MENEINKLFKIAGGAARSFSDGLKKQLIDYSPGNIVSILEEIEIKRSQYTTEANVEKIIVKALNEATGKAFNQYSVGGFSGLKIDIDIAKGQVGVELKLAKNLDNAGIQRLFGQVLYYSNRIYKKNLIVCVIGLEKEFNHIIKEVKEIIELQGVEFFYLTVK